VIGIFLVVIIQHKDHKKLKEHLEDHKCKFVTSDKKDVPENDIVHLCDLDLLQIQGYCIGRILKLNNDLITILQTMDN
jgi:hypothetical protein